MFRRAVGIGVLAAVTAGPGQARDARADPLAEPPSLGEPPGVSPPSGVPAVPPPPAPLYRLEAHGSCPAAADVDAALTPLLSGQDLPAAAPPAVVDLTDLGDRYRVVVAGRERTYVDSARRCDERARVAAIFAALTLRPPAVAVEEAPPPPPPPPPPRPRPVPRLLLDVLGAAELDTQSWGGRVGFAAGSRRWTWGADVILLAPVTVDFPLASTRIWRCPFTAWGGWQHLGAVAAVRTTLGLSADVLRVEGRGLAPGETRYRMSPAMRAEVGFWLWPDAAISPALSLFGSYGPWPLHVTAKNDPTASAGGETDIGSLSRFWLGATAGISAKWP